jgi:hypothetical protein
MKLRNFSSSDRSRACKDIVLFGAGRSGTTWLAQIIAGAGLELVFEPLNPGEVPEARRMKPVPLFCRKNETFKWERLFARMMKGEVRNPWTIRANAGAERRVIKFIRANLLIEWILEHFDVHPLFITRNPLSVVASIKEQEWVIKASWVQNVLSAPRLYEPFFSRIPKVAEWTSRDLSEAEVRALYWCIHNHVPRSMSVFGRLHEVRYEELCKDPEAIIGRLAPKIGIEVDAKVRSAFSQPSFMRGKRQDTSGYDPMKAWRDVLPPADVEAVTRIVEAFGLERFIDR